MLPPDPAGAARVRALFQVIAADTHALASMRVGAYLKQRLGHDDAQVRAWQHHWIGQSFDALETLLSRDPSTGEFSHGDRPSLADIALVPQAHTAGRNGLEFGAWPTISRISDACLRLPAFAQAHPDHVLNPTVQDTQEQNMRPTHGEIIAYSDYLAQTAQARVDPVAWKWAEIETALSAWPGNPKARWRWAARPSAAPSRRGCRW